MKDSSRLALARQCQSADISPEPKSQGLRGRLRSIDARPYTVCETDQVPSSPRRISELRNIPVMRLWLRLQRPTYETLPAAGHLDCLKEAMRFISSEYIPEATVLVESRIGSLQELSYEEAKALPEAAGIASTICGRNATLTVFRQVDAYELHGTTLLVVLAATPTMLGMGAFHVGARPGFLTGFSDSTPQNVRGA